MESAGDVFQAAVRDYHYLLEKGYSQKSILKLVGDRYQLRTTQRSMLYRGICTKEQSLLRKRKQVLSLPGEAILVVDGYNVIRTIGSYLLGKTVFVATDGFLRDAAEMHRSVLKQEILHKVIGSLFVYLSGINPARLTFFLDQPVSKSGELASTLVRQLEDHHINGDALTVYAPDHQLKQVEQGIICTADSAIIDESKVDVFDLAYAVLMANYQPELPVLKVGVTDR